MRTQIKLAVLLLSAFAQHPSSSHAQGSLTPPAGPLGPTMKTLAQIEPRTPISSAPFTISVPGSYYLTTNLTVSGGNAIAIATNGVTLDLNGFTISSTAPSATGSGVLINNGLRDLAISNGSIQGGVTNNGSGVYSGSGFAYGISGSPYNTRVSGVSVSGCLYVGIYLFIGNSTVVEFCTVRTMGQQGIYASVITASGASDCGEYGIYGEHVSDCRGEATGSGTGLYAFRTAQNCYGISGGSGTGLFSHQAQNCQGNSNSGIAVSASSAQNCQGQSVSGTGLLAITAQNCIGSSTSGTGLSTDRLATSCSGFSGTGTALSTPVAQNCYGHTNGSGTGISASRTASNSSGYSSTGTGLSAVTAQNCYGVSTSGTGLSAVTAENCHGVSTSGYGMQVQKVANNCFGSGFMGVSLGSNTPGGGIATNCFGISSGNGHGILARIAIGCYGQSPNAFGINAFIANSCDGTGSPIGVGATHKYNMPP